MFTSIVAKIALVVALVVSSPKPEVEVVTLPDNVQEQVLNIDNIDNEINLYNEIRNSCTRSGCSLASHK